MPELWTKFEKKFSWNFFRLCSKFKHFGEIVNYFLHLILTDATFQNITFLWILEYCESLKASAPRTFRWTVSGFSEHNKQSWLLRIATEKYFDFFALSPKDENRHRIDHLDFFWDCSNCCCCWIRYLHTFLVKKDS